MRNSDKAYKKLKNMIIRTELQPGEVINESVLMETIEIGRTPIREALNRLSWDRLVEIIPRKGIMVTQVSLNDLQSIFELRYALEDLIGRIICERISDGDIEMLQEVLKRGCNSDDSEFEINVDIDKNFHIGLAKITGNRFLIEDYTRIYSASLRLLYLNKSKMHDLSETIDECERILKVIIAENCNGLSRILRNHVIDFKKKVLSNY